MTTLTAAQVIRDVRQMAKDKPNNVYIPTEEARLRSAETGNAPQCFYTMGKTKDGETGCIFGQIFTKHGIDAKCCDIPTPMGIAMALDRLNIKHTEPQAKWMEALQDHQDEGYTWENAVKVADSSGYDLDWEPEQQNI